MNMLMKDNGPIRETDLTTEAITRLKWFSTMAVLIVPGFLTFEFISDTNVLSFAGLAMAILGAAGLIGVMSNPLTSVFGRRDTRLDEWSLALKAKAIKFSYIVILYGIAILWAVTALLSILDTTQNNDLTLSWAKIQSVAFAALMIFFVLPAAYIAWRVKPLTDD